MRLWKYESLTVTHYPAKFGVDRHCVSGDIMGLVCPVILPEYVNASSYDFMCESLSIQVTILLSLVAMGYVVVEI